MIYLDHNATTPIAPEVLEAMMPYLTSEWGNPSSAYKFGAKLKGVIETAREQVAELIGAQASEIVFTSCATESNNAAIHAALKATGKRHVVTSAVEHSSVLNYVRALEGQAPASPTGVNHGLHGSHGSDLTTETQRSRSEEEYRVTYLPVGRDGLLKLADLENAITEETAVVSLMWANNETGVLFPVKEIAEICRARGVLFHCDAVQAAGKIPINVRDVSVDYLAITGHKLNAPKGIGVLYVRRKAPFVPLIVGGHQERNWRGGTGEGANAELRLSNSAVEAESARPAKQIRHSSFPTCAGGWDSEFDSEYGVERAQGAAAGQHDQHHVSCC